MYSDNISSSFEFMQFPRYIKLQQKTQSMLRELGSNEGKKLLRRLLNDCVRKHAKELDKWEIIDGMIKINTLLPKIVSDRYDWDNSELSQKALVCLLNSVFVDRDVEIEAELWKEIKEFFMLHGDKNDDKEFSASFRDIAEIMKKAIDNLNNVQ